MSHGMDGSGVMGLGWIFWVILLVVIIGTFFIAMNRNRKR